MCKYIRKDSRAESLPHLAARIKVIVTHQVTIWPSVRYGGDSSASFLPLFQQHSKSIVPMQYIASVKVSSSGTLIFLHQAVTYNIPHRHIPLSYPTRHHPTSAGPRLREIAPPKDRHQRSFLSRRVNFFPKDEQKVKLHHARGRHPGDGCASVKSHNVRRSLP